MESKYLKAFSDLYQVIEGRERYIRALKGLRDIEKVYRREKNKLAKLAKAGSKSKAGSEEPGSESAGVSDIEGLFSDAFSEAHAKSAEIVRQVCQQNGATWVKFAQFLSCRPDIFPDEYIRRLQTMQDRAPSVVLGRVMPVLLRCWGDEWEKRFHRFDVVPIATASVAQVYKAQLNTGEWVAVKVRIPGVVKLFEQDAIFFKMLASVLDFWIKGVDVKQITDQLIEMTLTELDFTHEIHNQMRFAMFVHHPDIRVPKLFPDYCSEEIIVTEWIDGIPLREYVENPDHSDSIESVLKLLANSFMQQIMSFGVYHADPHPGNFLVCHDRQIAILDYGLIASLSEQERRNFVRLILRVMGYTQEPLDVCFKEAGFKGVNKKMLEKLSVFVTAKHQSKQTDDVAESLTALLGQLRAFQITIPDSFVAMARVLITIGGFLDLHGYQFSWLSAWQVMQ